jgi:hypothetical protein
MDTIRDRLWNVQDVADYPGHPAQNSLQLAMWRHRTPRAALVAT